MSDKIKRAELLARFVHLTQRRQDGEEYIKHCERIVNWLQTKHISFPDIIPTEDMLCAAWLHDSVEDSMDRYFIHNLIRKYFGDDVHTLVHLLTHWEYYTYNEYILRVSKNPIALQIKWIDMIDNTSYSIPEKQWNKYREACIFLGTKGIEIPKILQDRLKL